MLWLQFSLRPLHGKNFRCKRMFGLLRKLKTSEINVHLYISSPLQSQNQRNLQHLVFPLHLLVHSLECVVVGPQELERFGNRRHGTGGFSDHLPQRFQSWLVQFGVAFLYNINKIFCLKNKWNCNPTNNEWLTKVYNAVLKKYHLPMNCAKSNTFPMNHRINKIKWLAYMFAI